MFRGVVAAPPPRDGGDVTWVLSRTVGRGVTEARTPVWVTGLGMKDTLCLSKPGDRGYR